MVFFYIKRAYTFRLTSAISVDQSTCPVICKSSKSHRALRNLNKWNPFKIFYFNGICYICCLFVEDCMKNKLFQCFLGSVFLMLWNVPLSTKPTTQTVYIHSATRLMIEWKLYTRMKFSIHNVKIYLKNMLNVVLTFWTLSTDSVSDKFQTIDLRKLSFSVGGLVKE